MFPRLTGYGANPQRAEAKGAQCSHAQSGSNQVVLSGSPPVAYPRASKSAACSGVTAFEEPSPTSGPLVSHSTNLRRRRAARSGWMADKSCRHSGSTTRSKSSKVWALRQLARDHSLWSLSYRMKYQRSMLMAALMPWAAISIRGPLSGVSSRVRRSRPGKPEALTSAADKRVWARSY